MYEVGSDGIQTIALEENCPPVRVRVWIRVRVSFRIGAIFFGSNCPRTGSDSWLDSQLERLKNQQWIVLCVFILFSIKLIFKFSGLRAVLALLEEVQKHRNTINKNST